MSRPHYLPEETSHSDVGAERRVVRGRRGRQLVCELVRDFARDSTLHGLRYLTARGLSTLEKVFWGMTTLLSVCLCGWAISSVWARWNASPIIITVDQRLTAAAEVPFPAVTVCPQAKINQKHFNFTKHYITYMKFMAEKHYHENISEEEQYELVRNFTEQTYSMRQLVNIDGLICDALRNPEQIPHFKYYEFAHCDHTSVQYAIQAAPTFEDICMGSRGVKDNSYIAPVLLEEGLCFTYNSLPSEEIFHMHRIQTNYSYLNASTPRRGWTPEDGYSGSVAREHAYPRPGTASSTTKGFSLLLNNVQDQDFLCDHGSFQGYKVYLHHPAELAQASPNYQSVEAGQKVALAVAAHVISTSPALATYPPHVRQCYYPRERELRYFRTYTASNCELECRANRTRARCGCVAFYMPNNDSTVLCMTRKDKNCLYKSLRDYEPDADAGAGAGAGVGGGAGPCGCLPLCHSVRYEAHAAAKALDFTLQYEAEHRAKNEILNTSEPFKTNLRWHKISSFTVYFKESRFVSLRRSELLGPADFLANCGGLLGLFLGFSFLSLVELIYYFTLRLICMFRRQEKVAEKKKADHA